MHNLHIRKPKGNEINTLSDRFLIETSRAGMPYSDDVYVAVDNNDVAHSILQMTYIEANSGNINTKCVYLDTIEVRDKNEGYGVATVKAIFNYFKASSITGLCIPSAYYFWTTLGAVSDEGEPLQVHDILDDPDYEGEYFTLQLEDFNKYCNKRLLHEEVYKLIQHKQANLKTKLNIPTVLNTLFRWVNALNISDELREDIMYIVVSLSKYFPLSVDKLYRSIGLKSINDLNKRVRAESFTYFKSEAVKFPEENAKKLVGNRYIITVKQPKHALPIVDVLEYIIKYSTSPNEIEERFSWALFEEEVIVVVDYEDKSSYSLELSNVRPDKQVQDKTFELNMRNTTLSDMNTYFKNFTTIDDLDATSGENTFTFYDSDGVVHGIAKFDCHEEGSGEKALYLYSIETTRLRKYEGTAILNHLFSVYDINKIHGVHLVEATEFWGKVGAIYPATGDSISPATDKMELEVTQKEGYKYYKYYSTFELYRDSFMIYCSQKSKTHDTYIQEF